MTFRDTSHQELAHPDQETEASYQDTLREILNESGLPAIVAAAPISRVMARSIDELEIDRLTDPATLNHDGPGGESILERRRSALSKYLGLQLTCVLIHLPGARYTIEIDVGARKVVYWEAT